MHIGKVAIIVLASTVSITCALHMLDSQVKIDSYNKEIKKCKAYLVELHIRNQKALEVQRQCDYNDELEAKRRRLETVSEPDHLYFMYNGQLWDANTPMGRTVYNVATQSELMQAKHDAMVLRALANRRFQ